VLARVAADLDKPAGVITTPNPCSPGATVKASTDGGMNVPYMRPGAIVGDGADL
jgi:hypothetical protein